jgi:uncharacterized oxidoreductase
MKMSGNTILITGGATGIGYALAEAFIKLDNEVIICGRRLNRLEEARKKYPSLNIRQCDVSDSADRESLVEWTLSNFSKLNILVNNAGIQRDIDLTKGTVEFLKGQDEIRINLEAPILLSVMFIPHLLKMKEPAIINVSSGLGFVPAATMPVYCATKAALHSFSMSMRYQLSKTPVKVFEIIPPGVDTELNPEGRAKRNYSSTGVQPAELAAAVMKELEKDHFEIGYSYTEDFRNASRSELDDRFMMMNSRWQ